VSDLAAEIAEYCRNVERKPVNQLKLIENIMQDAQATKQWPIATVKQWAVAIEVAIERGLLRRDSETIWIPEVAKVVKHVQRDLF